MQSIGLSVEEIAIVYLALPLTTFLAPPVSGTYNYTKWVYYVPNELYFIKHGFRISGR